MRRKGLILVKVIVGMFVLPPMLIGCSTVQLETRLKFNLLIIQNNSDRVLENVKIKVEQTGALASCSVVLPGRSCSTGFRSRTYEGNPIFVSWLESGQNKRFGPLIVEPPQVVEEQDATALLELDSHEQISARFVY